MRVGELQLLRVQEVVNHGFMVGDEEGSAMLRRHLAPEDIAVGDHVNVFIYTDKDGEPIATSERPYAMVGEFALLEVVDVSRHGIHLDWGLERDLFVPFGLQHERLEVGDRVVVYLTLDDEGRVFASNKLVEFFDENLDDLANDQPVDLLVYGFNNYGALVVVDSRYTGIVYRSETFQMIRLGDELKGYIKALRHDGKIDVALQRNKKPGINDARDVLWQRLQDRNGFLPLTDKSDPEDIRRELAMSKKQFKKAVGSLYKTKKITLEDGGIRIAKEPSS